MDPSGRLQQFMVDATTEESIMQVRSGDQIIVPRRRSFFRDVFIPAIGIIGSVASLGLLIDRYSRD
jgi:hypothetical protein